MLTTFIKTKNSLNSIHCYTIFFVNNTAVIITIIVSYHIQLSKIFCCKLEVKTKLFATSYVETFIFIILSILFIILFILI